MVDAIVGELAREKGFEIIGDVAVSERGEWTVAYSYSLATVYWHASVAVDLDFWDKDLQKQLVKAVGRAGIVRCRNGAVSILCRGSTRKGRLEKLERAGELLLEILPGLGARPACRCTVCGLEGCDERILEETALFPAHEQCKQEKARILRGEMEENRKNGNIVFAVLCALVGGLAGCVPSLALVYFTGYFFAWLFVCIPLAAFYAYKLGKGILGGFVPWLIAAISLISTIMLTLAAQYMLVLRELGATVAEFSFGFFAELIAQPEVIGEIIGSFVMPAAFCVIGVVISWRSISLSQRSKMDQIRQLGVSMKSPPETLPEE